MITRVLFVALGISLAAQDRVPITPPTAKTFLAASDAPRDTESGLPTRIIHQPTGIEFVLIRPGEFMMGSPADESDRGRRERQHRRVVRKSFYLARTEVTVDQFRKFAETTGYKTDAERGVSDGNSTKPGSFAALPEGEREWSEAASWRNPFPNLKDVSVNPKHPVIHVSWNDSQAFCKHFGFRLPTEAQWEYAARAGTQARYAWGSAPEAGSNLANLADQSAVKRFPDVNVSFPFDDGHAILAAVGSYQPNAWGLYDMVGNVEEWCEDTVGEYPPDGSDESAAVGPGPAKVLRGASWLGNPGIARVAARVGMTAAARRDFQGFRVAIPAEEAKAHLP